MTNTVDGPTHIPIPPEVDALFDKADSYSEYGALLCPDSVKLVKRDGTVVEEVKWADSWRFAKNALRVLARSSRREIVGGDFSGDGSSL